MNVTVPVGVPAEPETVAVSERFCPTTVVADATVTIVGVAWVIVADSFVLLHGWVTELLFASPL